MKAQVAEMALDLFLEKGYEQTTVDDICTVAGISRSTFFRYFPSKEDVFMDKASTAGEDIRESLEQRPDDEPVWAALRHAMQPVVASYAAQSGRTRQLATLGRSTAALSVLHLEKYARMLDLLTPEVARRLGADPDDATDPRPRALIAAALGCLEVAVAAWIAGGGTQQLADLLDRAMRQIGEETRKAPGAGSGER